MARTRQHDGHTTANCRPDAEEGIAASLRQLLDYRIDVHDVLPIVVCLDQLVSSLRHARSATWRREQRSSLAKDFDAAFDVVGARTREALGNAVYEVHDLVRRVLTANTKVSEHRDFNRLLSGAEELRKRVVDAGVRRATWRDVVDGLRESLPERVLEDRVRLLFALLGGAHLEPEEDRQHLHWVIAEGGVPESGPGSEVAPPGAAERLAVCEEYVSRAVPSENCIAWVALDGTFLPEFVVEAGPVTFFLAEWAVPNAKEDDGQLFLYRDELREIVMTSPFEVPHETNVVLARVELGERPVAGALDEAWRQAMFVAGYATLSARSDPWPKRGWNVLSVDDSRHHGWFAPDHLFHQRTRIQVQRIGFELAEVARALESELYLVVSRAERGGRLRQRGTRSGRTEPQHFAVPCPRDGGRICQPPRRNGPPRSHEGPMGLRRAAITTREGNS